MSTPFFPPFHYHRLEVKFLATRHNGTSCWSTRAMSCLSYTNDDEDDVFQGTDDCFSFVFGSTFHACIASTLWLYYVCSSNDILLFVMVWSLLFSESEMFRRLMNRIPVGVFINSTNVFAIGHIMCVIVKKSCLRWYLNSRPLHIRWALYHLCYTNVSARHAKMSSHPKKTSHILTIFIL